MVRTNSLAILLVGFWLMCPGCAPEPPPGIGHYIAAPKALLRLDRVVLVALECEEGDSEIGEGMTEALFQAVQERRLFHVQLVRTADPAYADLVLPVRRPCTLEELSEMRKSLRCGAVMFGSMRGFRPYPRMKMGLYLRLIDLRRGKLLWAVDHTWDTTDKITEVRMRDFFAERTRSGYDPVYWRLAMLSPRAFERFVAHEVAGTLPARAPPPPAAGGDSWAARTTLVKIAEIPKNVSRTCGFHRE